MPYPAGMETRFVTLAPILDGSGNSLKTVIRVGAERAFIWAATSEVFMNRPIEAQMDGLPVSIELPVPGQAGFVDGAGNTISDWTYTATYNVVRGGDEIPDINFALPSGGTALELTPDVSTIRKSGVVNTPVPVTGDAGASAYEIAVNEGFIGTEEEWLATLVGPPGGAFVSAFWSYNSSTSVPPGAGQVRSDEPITTLYIHETDADGFDRSGGFAAASADDFVQIAASDGNSYTLQISGAPTDNGTYWSLPVTVVSADPTPKKNTRIQVALVPAATGGGGGGGTWGSITGTLSDQADLQTELDGKAATSHTHVVADTTGLQTALDGKAATSHTHAISDTTGLQTALNGKAATSHTHAISDTTGLQTALDGKITAFADPNADRIVFWDDSASAFAPMSIGSGLSITGTQIDVPIASTSVIGRMEYATDAEVQSAFVVGTGDPFKGMNTDNFVRQSVAAATPNYVIRRDSAGRAKVADPSVAADIATKGYVDTAVAGGGGGSSPIAAMTPRVSGDYMAAVSGATNAGGSAYAGTNVEMTPILIGVEFDIDAMGVQVTTTEAINVRILLYDSGPYGWPTNLVATVTVSGSSSGNVFGTLGSPVTLSPGLYWGCVRTDSGSTWRCRASSVAEASKGLSAVSFSIIQGARTPLPTADVGTYASPTDPITSWGDSSSGSSLWPNVILRKA